MKNKALKVDAVSPTRVTDSLAGMRAAVAEAKQGQRTMAASEPPAADDKTRIAAPTGAAVKSGADAGKHAPPRQPKGPGLVLFGLAVGLLAGFAAYGLTVGWIDTAPNVTLGQSLIVFLGVAAASLILIAERGALLRGALPAIAIGAALAAPTWFMLEAHIDARNLAAFPPMFWFLAGAPATALTLVALARAGAAPRGEKYTEFFSSAVTLPLAALGGLIVAALGVTLVYAFASMMRTANVNVFHVVFQQPLFMLPFLGASAGAALGLVRSLDAVQSAMRYAVVFLARALAPVAAALSFAALVVFSLKGAGALFAPALAGPAFLAIALAAGLLFNGVYQNGEGGPPPAWLRLSALVLLAAAPALSAVAAAVFWSRIGDLGLTPARLFGLVLAGVACLYAVVSAAGFVSELRWGAARWMPAVAPLNIGMAALWATALPLMATPAVNAWAISARDQELRVIDGRADPAAYDYGYLRFSLGAAGEAALKRLAAVNHPQAESIRAGARRALEAASYALYRDPPPAPRPAAPAAAETPAPAQTRGVDALEFNPKDGAFSSDD